MSKNLFYDEEIEVLLKNKYSYVSVLGATQLLKLKDAKILVIPFCIVITIVSVLLARNYPEHIKLGLDFTVKYIHLPIQIVIPSITLMICCVKKWIFKNDQLANS